MSCTHKYVTGICAYCGERAAVRCEGMRRYGGVFSLGPPIWEQCKNDATVSLKLRQEWRGETSESEMPSCMICWNEALETEGIEVLSAKPIGAA